jgi:hypothetical protein
MLIVFNALRLRATTSVDFSMMVYRYCVEQLINLLGNVPMIFRYDFSL